MKSYSIIIIFLCVSRKSAKDPTTKPMKARGTPGINERVALLKYQIEQEIKKSNFATEKMFPINNDDFSDSYDYVDTDEAPITPIMDFDKRKRHGKYRLRELKTTATQIQLTKKAETKKPKDSPVPEPTIEDTSSEELIKTDGKIHGIDNAFKPPVIFNPNTTISSAVKKNKHLRNKKRHGMSKTHRDNVFYRRVFYGNTKNINKCAVHCQDLITPFLTGVKTNITELKVMTVNDPFVIRLIQLLREDTSESTKEEIYSIMYQISNIQIRLFQWDTISLKLLFNTISRENLKRHSFRTLKQGVKRTLASWHMDFTNTTNLLKQARLFRPPCIRACDVTGSTKSSAAFRYSKVTKPRCGDGEDGEDCYAEI